MGVKKILKISVVRRSILLFLSFIGTLNFSLAQNTLSLYQLKVAVLDSINTVLPQYSNLGQFRVRKIIPYKNSGKIVVEMSDNFSYIPFREDIVDSINSQALKALHINYPDYDAVEIVADDHNISFYIPNIYRSRDIDAKRLSKHHGTTPFIRPCSQPYSITSGLQDRNIALWQSHGLYYDSKNSRWCWQRARVMTTVEDKFTLSFVVPYLLPMLERAGANVFLPRERDFQQHEVIVDNNNSEFVSGTYLEVSSDDSDEIYDGNMPGFAYLRSFYTDSQNPFSEGTYRVMKASHTPSAHIEWHPSFPESGWYCVSVAYHTEHNSVSDAHYTIKHSAGETSFTVNQKMGGGTWIYLGRFYFNKDDDNAVILTNGSGHHGVVTADAVRFGGGIGNVRRYSNLTAPAPSSDAFAETSGRLRFWEAARYWLQWAGAPYHVVSYSKGKNDYVDDYSCRGLWVNWLNNGSANAPDSVGLNIPVDLAFAFHSDAGCNFDTVIGTLGIFTTMDNKGNKNALLPTGHSRYASRDLTDIVMSQIVSDVRAQINPQWTRRGMWNKSYSESRRPQVPTMLLELLSHQNMEDMKYGLDPRFKFIVSRAVYKGMARFISSQNKTPLVITPLPVTDFVAELDSLQQNVSLRWNAVADTLESTATAERFVVYTRVDGEGWNNGFPVDSNEVTIPIAKGELTSYKVVAVNAGGASMDSEVLTAYAAPDSKGEVLVVNGFTRLSAPESFKAYPYAGFAFWNDRGVADGVDLQFAGDQNEFDSRKPWVSDDASGWGNSNSDHEFDINPANTHDFPFVHGKAIAANGYSFSSSSLSAVENRLCNLSKYSVADFIFGEQKTTFSGVDRSKSDFTIYTPQLCSAIEEFTTAGGNLFISGAYVVSDPWIVSPDKKTQQFCTDVLGVSWRADKATQNGMVKAVSDKLSFEFAQKPNDKVYAAESPDALFPAKNASAILRYSQNNTTAGIVFDSGNYRTFVCGFPFETILNDESRNALMHMVLDYLGKK